MRVLLIKPGRVGRLGLDRTSFVEPLGLEMVAACLPQHDVRILDLRLEPAVAPVLEEFRPDYCGISCGFTTEARSCLEIACTVKDSLPQCLVVIGGTHPSLCPEDFAHPAVDLIVVGEAEATVPELFVALADNGSLDAVPGLVLNGPEGQRATSPRPAIADLDQLPFPARHLVADAQNRYYMGFDRPYALVETGRGCPYRCRFCAVWKFHQGRIRHKSPARVVAELAQIRAPYVFFTDDNFLSDVARSHDIADRLRAAGIRKSYTFQCRADAIARYPDLLSHWREVGRINVFVGMEKIEQEGLDEIDKKSTVADNGRALDVLRDSGVNFFINFIVPPQADREEFARLRDYVTRHGLHNAWFSILTPFPGTDLFDDVKDQLTTGDYELFDLLHAVTPTRLPLDEFYREFASVWAAVRAAGSSTRWYRTSEFLKAVVSRRVSLASLRLGMNLPRTLSDPMIYLVDHQQPAMGEAHALP